MVDTVALEILVELLQTAVAVVVAAAQGLLAVSRLVVELAGTAEMDFHLISTALRPFTVGAVVVKARALMAATADGAEVEKVIPTLLIIYPALLLWKA